MLFNILEYLSFLNLEPIKSPNNVQRVNDTQLLTVNIKLIKNILNVFELLSKNIENISEIMTYALGLNIKSNTPSIKLHLTLLLVSL